MAKKSNSGEGAYRTGNAGGATPPTSTSSTSTSSSSTSGTQPPGVGEIPPPPSIIFPEIEIPPAAPPPPPPPPPVPTGGQTALRVSDALRKKFRATSLADQNRKVGRPSTILTGPQGSTGSVSSPMLSGTLFG